VEAWTQTDPDEGDDGSLSLLSGLQLGHVNPLGLAGSLSYRW
jgi:hypothetical protein